MANQSQDKAHSAEAVETTDQTAAHSPVSTLPNTTLDMCLGKAKKAQRTLDTNALIFCGG